MKLKISSRVTLKPHKLIQHIRIALNQSHELLHNFICCILDLTLMKLLQYLRQNHIYNSIGPLNLFNEHAQDKQICLCATKYHSVCEPQIQTWAKK